MQAMSEMRQKYPGLFLNLSVPIPLTPWQKFQAVMGRRDLMDQHYHWQMHKCCVELQRKLFQLEETPPCPSHAIQPQAFGTETPCPPDPGMTMMQIPCQPYRWDPPIPPQGSWVWTPCPPQPGMTMMQTPYPPYQWSFSGRYFN